MDIRQADKQTDYNEVWDIFQNIISTGDTYVFSPNTTKEEMERHWFAGYIQSY